MLSKDLRAAFDIANRFDLRHRKIDQNTGYDPVICERLFDWHLSKIHLIRRLQTMTSPEETELEFHRWLRTLRR